MRSRTSVGARGRRVGAQTKRGDLASAAPSAPASRPAGAARAALVMPRSRGFASGRRRGCASPSFRNSGVALMAASAAAWLATRAIDAATLRAGAAPAHDALAKGFSSAEDTNASIVGGNASFDGVVLHRETLDVDATQCQRVLGLQSFGEARDAPADGVPLVGLSLLVELASEHRKRAVVRASPTVVIDDGVAQHPVEPRHGGLRALEGHLVEATRERFLEDVLRRVAVADPPLEEREKRATVLDEHRSYLASWRELGNFAGGLASPLLHSVLQTQRTRIVRAARKGDHADVRANGYTCSQEELA